MRRFNNLPLHTIHHLTYASTVRLLRVTANDIRQKDRARKKAMTGYSDWSISGNSKQTAGSAAWHNTHFLSSSFWVPPSNIRPSSFHLLGWKTMVPTSSAVPVFYLSPSIHILKLISFIVSAQSVFFPLSNIKLINHPFICPSHLNKIFDQLPSQKCFLSGWKFGTGLQVTHQKAPLIHLSIPRSWK